MKQKKDGNGASVLHSSASASNNVNTLYQKDGEVNASSSKATCPPEVHVTCSHHSFPLSLSSSSLSSSPSSASAKSSSSKLSSSAHSISDLLERDNWNSRSKYLTPEGLHSAVSSLSSASSVSSSSSSSSSTCSDSSFQQNSLLNESEYAHLDRYGFIHLNPTSGDNDEDNHILFFRRPDPNDPDEIRRREERKRRLDEREARRSMKWLEMLSVLQTHPVAEWPKRHAKYRSRLAKGIPDCIRCQVWPLLATAILSKGTEACSGQPLAYSQTPYKDLYLRISGFERQIDLDIERTLRDHVMFKIRFSSAQVSLFKMLVAYSNYDREVGYCQGMSSIAAFLLLYLPEETAFATFLGVMSETRELFVAGFPKLFETFYIQERLMRKYLSQLHKHLAMHSITPSIYATKWYLTLFLGFPFVLSTRIWDLFLAYGFEIMPCIAIAILRMLERKILGSEYEQAMQILARLPEDGSINVGQIIRIAVRLYEDIDSNEKHRGFRKYREAYQREHRQQNQ